MLSYVLVALLSVALAVLFIPRDWSFKSGQKSSQEPPVRLLSKRELSLYDGEEGSRGLYLAILGQVFDVQNRHKHYGPGGSYHFMAGRDASLSFVTGDFSETGLTDDVSSLSPLQLVVLFQWLDFYQRECPAVGILIGRFYNESGHPTEALLKVRSLLAEGQRLKTQSDAEKERFPACNSEWSSSGSGRVWCSNKSGGVTRDWTGVPRKLFSPASSGVRCVCVKDASTAEEDPNLQKYEGCLTHAESCLVSED